MVPSPLDERRRQLADLSSRQFDLLVIGGGITGCGIARDAALRGVRVALVEANDFASGTSSRSSRLIHGGVRYIEHGQLHLVFEASAERRRLLRLAPHLVRPLEFTWPIYDNARLPEWKVRAGLTAYDVLALFRNVGRHHRLTAEAVLQREPLLRHDGLESGATYFDAATNDARLTLANAIGASEASAVVVNHTRATSFLTRGGRLAGLGVEDALTQSTVEVLADTVVNAAGPWSDPVRALSGRGAMTAVEQPTVRGSKGAHASVPRNRIGNRGALTLLSPIDGRVMFVLPDEDRSILGTTDTYTDETPSAVRASRGDVQYLLDSANAFFPAARLEPSDVIAAWAGIRPLLPSSGGAPGPASREHAIHVEEDGLISVTGGKLTTYRAMAREIVDLVVKQNGRRARSQTSRIPLPGAEEQDVDREIEEAVEAIRNPDLATHLVHWYGARWRAVLASSAPNTAEWTPESVLEAQARYAVLHENAWTLADVLIRRTGIAFTTRDQGASLAPGVATVMGPLLRWSNADQESALERYSEEAARVFSIAS